MALHRCPVSLLQTGEAQVPAQEAGVLVAISVRKGQQVSKRDVLGQIDTSQAELSQRVAGLQLEVARERVINEVNRRYTEKAAELAKSEYKKAVLANSRHLKTVSEVEVDRLKLSWEKALLQIEQAQHDLKVFGLEAQVRQAEVDAAKALVARMQICSPLDGEVEELHRHVGEWVKPGDPVFHVVQMDSLQIEGFVSESRYAPWEIEGRPVMVEVELSRGRREQFTGEIVSVSSLVVNPLVRGGGEYRVCAEVRNRKQDQYWLLRPGQLTEMTIYLKDTRSAGRPGPITTRPSAR